MGEIDIDLPFIASVSLIQFDQCALRALSPSLKTVLMKKGCLAGVAQREHRSTLEQLHCSKVSRRQTSVVADTPESALVEVVVVVEGSHHKHLKAGKIYRFD